MKLLYNSADKRHTIQNDNGLEMVCPFQPKTPVQDTDTFGNTRLMFIEHKCNSLCPFFVFNSQSDKNTIWLGCIGAPGKRIEVEQYTPPSEKESEKKAIEKPLFAK